MACQYLDENNSCREGLPVVKKYFEFICASYPEKCPLFVTKLIGSGDREDPPGSASREE